MKEHPFVSQLLLSIIIVSISDCLSVFFLSEQGKSN